MVTDGCTNVSGNVTARVVCPAASIELPPLPSPGAFVKYVGDSDVAEGGRTNRSVRLTFEVNGTAGANGSVSTPDVPTLLSWSFLGQDCPEETVGFESMPGAMGPKAIGVDLTNSNDGSGGQCLLDATPASGVLSTANETSLHLAGVGSYRVLQSVWDGCRVVDRELVVEVKCNPTPVPVVHVALAAADQSLSAPGAANTLNAQEASAISLADDGTVDGTPTYHVTVSSSQRANEVIMPEILVNASMSFDAMDPRNQTQDALGLSRDDDSYI